VTGVRPLDGVHRKRADRVDGKLVDVGHVGPSFKKWVPGACSR
jgi:hypothetical protein